MPELAQQVVVVACALRVSWICGWIFAERRLRPPVPVERRVW